MKNLLTTTLSQQGQKKKMTPVKRLIPA